jgi:DNA-binding NtrC family response regulator
MTAQQPVLIVIDDEPGILDVVGRFAARSGFQVIACAGGREGIARVQSTHADLVMVDLRMPDVGGLEVLRAIRESNPNCQAVLMTGYASVETAVEAIKLGAMDYLSKPLDFGRLQQMLAGVRDEIERRRAVLSIERDLARHLEFCDMIGRGPAMQDLFGLIRRLAPHVKTALITGETGTGKELVARALHRSGPRHDRPFITVNCSAVIETLFEGELFGEARGGPDGETGHRKPGFFQAANGGTLLLDEVAELPIALQAKLLRALELGEVHPVGSAEPCPVDVQVIAATNRDLRAEVAAGRFRSELYYRLNSVEVKVPALRDRREDIPYLTAVFVRESADRLGKPLAGVTAGAERLLAAGIWAGNVRELKNVIQRACILCDATLITERELSVGMPHEPGTSSRAGSLMLAGGVHDGDSLASVEREHIQRALAKVGGNKKAAAQLLGLSRRALYRRLERLDLADSISRRREPELALTE